MKFKNPFKKRKGVQDENAQKEIQMYYDIGPIDATNAVYRMIIGQRSNGKTYSVCRHMVEDYFSKGHRSAYIRRWDEDIQPKHLASLFAPHYKLIEELSGGEYNSVFYRAKEFHLCYIDEEGKKVAQDPEAFCITASINTAEHTKGQDRGEIHLILFDEFMTRQGYLQNEFIQYCNLLSSLIRNRDDAIIYMCANTVNRYCPYFKEMGLKDVETMPQGQVYVYTYGNMDLTVAVEYCDPVKATEKVASKYFAFDNPQLEMITTGAWELQFYPRPTYKIFEEDIKYRFYIHFGETMLCGEIVKPTDKEHRTDLFIFIHPQTKDIEIDSKTVLYTDEFTTSICHVRFLSDQPTELHRLITSLFKKKSVCFSDNETGEIVRNWLIEVNGLKLF